MVIGCLTVELYMPESASLKYKRRQVRSVCDRLRHRFNVAVAEVDDQDVWQRAVLAIVCVSGDKSHAERILTAIERWLAQAAGDMIGQCVRELF